MTENKYTVWVKILQMSDYESERNLGLSWVLYPKNVEDGQDVRVSEGRWQWIRDFRALKHNYCFFVWSAKQKCMSAHALAKPANNLF